MEDPRWAELTRRSGIRLEKVREGLIVVKDDDERPSDQREAVGKVDRDSPREADTQVKDDK